MKNKFKLTIHLRQSHIFLQLFGIPCEKHLERRNKIYEDTSWSWNYTDHQKLESSNVHWCSSLLRDSANGIPQVDLMLSDRRLCGNRKKIDHLPQQPHHLHLPDLIEEKTKKNIKKRKAIVWQLTWTRLLKSVALDRSDGHEQYTQTLWLRLSALLISVVDFKVRAVYPCQSNHFANIY